jgi:hypothetical protein
MKTHVNFLNAIVVCMILSLSMNATPKRKTKNMAFAPGKTYFSMGYGYGKGLTDRVLIASYSDYPGYTLSSVGVATFKIEHAVSQRIGIGISANYKYLNPSAFTDSTNQYKLGVKRVTYAALLRTNIHFGTTAKSDWYWGVGIGYRGGSNRIYNESPNALIEDSSTKVIPVGFETSLGMRYLFTPHIGMYVEVGLGRALAQGGLVFGI